MTLDSPGSAPEETSSEPQSLTPTEPVKRGRGRPRGPNYKPKPTSSKPGPKGPWKHVPPPPSKTKTIKKNAQKPDGYEALLGEQSFGVFVTRSESGIVHYWGRDGWTKKYWKASRFPCTSTREHRQISFMLERFGRVQFYECNAWEKKVGKALWNGWIDKRPHGDVEICYRTLGCRCDICKKCNSMRKYAYEVVRKGWKNSTSHFRDGESIEESWMRRASKYFGKDYPLLAVVRPWRFILMGFDFAEVQKKSEDRGYITYSELLQIRSDKAKNENL